MNFPDKPSDSVRLAMWALLGQTQRQRRIMSFVLLVWVCLSMVVLWADVDSVPGSLQTLLVVMPVGIFAEQSTVAAARALRVSAGRRLPGVLASRWLTAWWQGHALLCALALALAALFSLGSLEGFCFALSWASLGLAAGTWSGLWKGGVDPNGFKPVAAAMLLGLFVGSSWHSRWRIEISMALMLVSLGAGLLASWFALLWLRGVGVGAQRLALGSDLVLTATDPWTVLVRCSKWLNRWRSVGAPHEAFRYRSLLTAFGTSLSLIWFVNVGFPNYVDGVRQQDLWSTRLGLVVILTAMFRSALAVEQVPWRHWLLPSSNRRARLGQRVFISTVQIHLLWSALWMVGLVWLFRDSVAMREGFGSGFFRNGYLVLDACLALALAVCWVAREDARQAEPVRVPAWVGPAGTLDALATFGVLAVGWGFVAAPFLVKPGAWPLWTSGGLWWAIPTLAASAGLVRRADQYWAASPAGFVMLTAPNTSC